MPCTAGVRGRPGTGETRTAIDYSESLIRPAMVIVSKYDRIDNDQQVACAPYFHARENNTLTKMDQNEMKVCVYDRIFS